MNKNIKLSFKQLKHKKLGFTLVEILVVVGIIIILSGISYVGISEVRKSIRDNKRRADLNLLARALESFKADFGQYLPQTFYSTQPYPTGNGWEPEADRTMMPILKEGGNLTLVYPGLDEPIVKTKSVPPGYLSDYIKDPINDNSDWDDSRLYIYWSASYAQVIDLDSYLWKPFATFPMNCPDDLGGTCGIDGGNNTQTWGACCNTGCWDQYCIFNDNGTPANDSDDSLTWIIANNTNFGKYCYGENSTRNMALLATRLEKESKPEERFENVFAFCPTADENHPNHADFKTLKGYFPESKLCYDGTGEGNYNCDSDGWTAWGLNNYNYFIPLTGEYNLN